MLSQSGVRVLVAVAVGGAALALRTVFNARRRAEARRVLPPNEQQECLVRPGLASWSIPLLGALGAILVVSFAVARDEPDTAMLSFALIPLLPVVLLTPWLLRVRARYRPDGVVVRDGRGREHRARWSDIETVSFNQRRGGIEMITKSGDVLRLSMTLEGSEGLLQAIERHVGPSGADGVRDARRFIETHAA